MLAAVLGVVGVITVAALTVREKRKWRSIEQSVAEWHAKRGEQTC